MQKNNPKIKTQNSLNLLCFLLLIFFAAAMLISITCCKLTDKYFVKKSEYDLLSKENADLKEQLKENNEILQQNIIENATLSEQLLKKNNDIEVLNKKNLEKDEEISKLKEQVSELKEELSSKSIENLEKKIAELEKEPKKLKALLANINRLLQNVYIGSSAKEGFGYTFTAFSIEYEGRYYIITAGHCVSDNYANEGTFKFKANFSENWIYPELINYKSEFWRLNDFAVFYSDDIKAGLKVYNGQASQDNENYVLGSLDKGLSVFRKLGSSSKRGESGSPVINKNMEVVGIYVVYGYVYTPIKLVLEAIDETTYH